MREGIAQQSLLTQTRSQDKHPNEATETNVGKKKMRRELKKKTKKEPTSSRKTTISEVSHWQLRCCRWL